MNRKNKIIVSVVGIVVVLLALLGLTYAYYLTRIQGNTNTNSISVTSANLKVVYGENNPNIIIKEGAMPGEKLAEKTFTITNSGTSTTSYSIIIDNMENAFERNQDIKYTITKSGETNPIASGNLSVGTYQILVPKLEIEKDAIDTFTFILNYDEPNVDQSIDMGKNLSFRINISEEINTWNTAIEGTLLYALKNNQTSGTEITIPGKEASTINEKRIIEVEDDYGISYIYRGNVENNYVNYSNMCWRIVRIQGDGTVKLVLADEKHKCGINTGYSIDDNKSGYITDENNNIINNTYRDRIFSTEVFLFQNSNIETKLIEWISNKNLDKSKLKNNEWCIDTSVIKKIDHGYDIEPNWRAFENEYGIVKRLGAYATSSPTLKCNMKGLDGTEGIESKSTRYTQLIGLLTADEIAYAGALDNYNINNNYLTSNASEYYYYTLTPYTMWSYDDNVDMYTYNGKNLNSSSTKVCNTPYAIRPSIVLKSNVLVTTNDDISTYGLPGTSTNPYEII